MRTCLVLAATTALVLLLPGLARAASASPSTVAFGDVPINTSVSRDVTVTIDAGYSYGGAGGVSGLNPPFHYSSGTCTGATSGASCTVTETFTPTSAGPASGEVDPFECPNGGGQCVAIPIQLSGNGVSVASASPSSVDYGDVPINTSVSRDVTVTIDAGYSYGGAGGVSGLNPPFHYSAAACTGPTCTVTETFTPTAVGAASGEVDPFECPNGGGQCIAIPIHLAGNGVSVASASPASWDFGDVPLNATASKAITITLDAGYQFGGAGGVSALNPPYHFSSGSCSGSTCTVTESFTPASVGPASADLNVFECPTAGGTCIDIPVHFDGTGVAALTVTTTSVPDGVVGTAYPPTTLHASGGVSPYHWVVTAGSLPAGLSLDASTGELSGTPTAAGSFTFTVTATDSGAPTPQSASQTYTMTVTGTADLAVSLSAAPSPVQYKKPVTFTISVTNHGPNAADATLTNVLPSGSGFVSLSASTGSCTAPPAGSTGTMTCALGSLASGATATVTVTVLPTVKKATITDTASVAAGSFSVDPVAANDSATVTVQIK